MQDGNTPLHNAAAMGHLEVVQLLLQHGADKELKDNPGNKPVDVVCGGPFADGANTPYAAAITALLR